MPDPKRIADDLREKVRDVAMSEPAMVIGQAMNDAGQWAEIQWEWLRRKLRPYLSDVVPPKKKRPKGTTLADVLPPEKR